MERFRYVRKDDHDEASRPYCNHGLPERATCLHAKPSASDQPSILAQQPWQLGEVDRDPRGLVTRGRAIQLPDESGAPQSPIGRAATSMGIVISVSLHPTHEVERGRAQIKTLLLA